MLLGLTATVIAEDWSVRSRIERLLQSLTGRSFLDSVKGGIGSVAAIQMIKQNGQALLLPVSLFSQEQ